MRIGIRFFTPKRYYMECFHTPRYQPNHVGVEPSNQGSSFPIVSPNQGKKHPRRIIQKQRRVQLS